MQEQQGWQCISPSRRAPKSRSTRDLIVVCLVSVLTFGASVVFDFYDLFTDATRPLEAWEIDEIHSLFFALSLAFTWYAWRRVGDLRGEMAERQEAERNMRESERRYRTLVEGSLQGMWIHQQNRICFAKRALAELLRYGHPTELLGQECTWLVAPADQARLTNALAACLRQPSTPIQQEWQMRCKDGPWRWVESLLSPFVWYDAPAVLITVVDITERKREEQTQQQLAYELHDGLAQLLISTQHHLETCEVLWQRQAPQAPQALARGIACLSQAIDETRRLMARLRPVLLENLGLVPALQKYVTDVAQELDWAVEFKAEVQDLALSPATEAAIFRIVQEAITNARKHASTVRIAVCLRQVGVQGETLEVVVRDWGRGFEPARVRVDQQRFGLLGMRERAKTLGATCQVASQPGQGTTVSVRLPLAASPGP